MRHPIILLFLFICAFLNGQKLENPFRFPVLLSGNFGELRNNHFHSGIDFKTQGVEGKPVHAVQDGYVSRISVSPWGYGHALYLNHPDGTTTVYGHLQKFNDSIAAYVKNSQYELENFAVNLTLEPDQFPVKRGERIAYGGNTGGSAGPHLHFEVRDTESGEVIDPAPFYKKMIKDTRPPQIQGIMIYPFEGRGMVNNKAIKQEIKVSSGKSASAGLPGKTEAWGDIGIAVKAYDYMDNTHHIYGVRKITLFVDSIQVFQSVMDRFSLNDTRFLNSFVDYEEWKDRRSFYMKSFIDPGNRLPFLTSINRGVIHIREERPYPVRYELEDSFGNKTELNFVITGKEQEIQAPETLNREPFFRRSDNRFGARGIRLTIPRNNLYEDIYFQYKVKEDTTALASVHTLHDKPVALHESARLSLYIQHDTLANKEQYGIVRLQKGRPSWVGGEYRNGWLDTDIRELGTFTIRQDIKPPVITPVQPEKWIQVNRFTFRITDDLSGLKYYRGEIDGAYVLFELDGKTGTITYDFDKKRLSRGNHTLQVIARDACNNETVYTHSFNW